jgi:hypothetical protein
MGGGGRGEGEAVGEVGTGAGGGVRGQGRFESRFPVSFQQQQQKQHQQQHDHWQGSRAPAVFSVSGAAAVLAAVAAPALTADKYPAVQQHRR